MQGGGEGVASGLVVLEGLAGLAPQTAGTARSDETALVAKRERGRERGVS